MANENSNYLLFGDIERDERFINHYGEQIDLGMNAIIYARNGIAAKVYHEDTFRSTVFREAFSLAVMEELNIPAPKVYGVETFSGRYAVLMEQISGVSLSTIILETPERFGELMDISVKLQLEIHNATSRILHPVRMFLEECITKSPGLSPEEKDNLIAMLTNLPDGTSICHGDFHMGNILFDGESYTIIDWEAVACGCPSADACRSYLDYCIAPVNGIEEYYISKYCAASGRTRDEILAWLPVVAGAVYGYLPDKGKKIVRKFF